MVVSMEDSEHNRDIHIVPLDGSRPPYNVSRSPDNDSHPTWSPDGKLIAFVGKHDGTEVDIHYVWLRAEDDQTSTRERSVEKAVDKLNKVRKATPPVGVSGGVRRPDATPPSDATAKPPTETPTRPTTPRRTAPDVAIDFDRLAERVKVFGIPDSPKSDLFWSPDGKKLAFTAAVGGTRGTYYIEFPELGAPKQLSAQTGTQAKWLRQANQVVWLSNGVPAAFTPGIAGGAQPTTPAALAAMMARGGRGPARPGTPTPTAAPEGDSSAAGGYTFRALQEVDIPKKNAAVFDLAWRTMRDNWYDEKLNNRDWNAIRAKYIDVAAQCPDSESVGAVVSMMLGELNGSHLGFMPAPAGAAGPTRRGRGGPAAEPGWRDETAHLGIRFDPLHRGPGLRVRDIIPDGPADQKKSRIAANEVIVAIDGTPVDSDTDLTTILNGQPNREIAVKVKAADGKEREVTIRPTSYTAVRQLLYKKWLADNRAAVEKISNGKLGYIHVDAMSMPSFWKFEKELYNAGAGKEGLVIDVRENGGGSTTDHLLTALTQPVHAISVPRGGVPGYPQDRKVYTSWSKPIVVMCNQNSFSNAEIFSHAIKTLNRGKLVGVPTAGGVISTGAAMIMDVGMLRLPTRGWFLVNSGEDMELNGAVPDYIVWPEASYVHANDDPQIAKAVEVLAGEVQAWKAQPRPGLRKASERKP
jgi:tricorn protease